MLEVVKVWLAVLNNPCIPVRLFVIDIDDIHFLGRCFYRFFNFFFVSMHVLITYA